MEPPEFAIIAPGCEVCHHPSRQAIEQAIGNRKSFRAIAKDFRLGLETDEGEFRPNHNKVANHKKRHMDGQLSPAATKALGEFGNLLRTRLRHLDDQVDFAIKCAREGTPVVDHEGFPVYGPDGAQLRTPPDSVLLLRAVREGRANLVVLAGLHTEAENDGQDDDLKRLRMAMEDPTVRALLAQVDEQMARADQTVGRE